MLLDFFLIFVLLLSHKVISCLKDVVLHIEPTVVEYGGESTLRCTYNLEKAPLYSVKWYRGIFEFYRYTPKAFPNKRKFPLEGIDVDFDHSNDVQVVLRNITFILSGNFSCEVTAEDVPVVKTVTVSNEMLVVVMPNRLPFLITDKTSYMSGDILEANCSSAPSKPAAELSFVVNNILVCSTCETTKIPVGKLVRSELFLKLQLYESHFQNGRLILKCMSMINDLYQQESELKFYNSRDPVPERVTLNKVNSVGRLWYPEYSIVTVFFLCHSIV